MRIRDWINRGVGFGLLLSIILCIAGAALGALLMDKEILSVESQGVWIAAVWFMAAFSGSRLAAVTDSRRTGLSIGQCPSSSCMDRSMSVRVELVGRSSVICRERL